jgi:thiamine transport system ATP-binding protein
MLKISDLYIHQGNFHLSTDALMLDAGVHAVLGPSGAGKSTLLSVLAGFDRPLQGRILWRGTDITGLAPAQRPVAMLFQDNNLFPHLTIYRNIALALTHKSRITADQHDRILQVLDRVNLTGMAERKPAQLSGGQISRAALARVMLQVKPIVLLDEPFAALGPALKQEMLDLLADVVMQSGATVLMVTHDPSDALRIAPKTILVADHKITGAFDTREVLQNPPPALAAYLTTGG